MGWEAVLAALAPVTGSIIGGIQARKDRESNEDIANRNLRNQESQMAYERDLQERLFEREDTAYQRKVADMEAAGLNKVLAAGGSGLAAGSVVSRTTPQSGMKYDYETSPGKQYGAMVENVLGRAKQFQDILAQKKNIAYTQSQLDLAESQKAVSDLKFEKDLHDIMIYKRFDMPSTWTPGGLVKDAQAIGGIAHSAYKVMQGKAEATVKKLTEGKYLPSITDYYKKLLHYGRSFYQKNEKE